MYIQNWTRAPPLWRPYWSKWISYIIRVTSNFFLIMNKKYYSLPFLCRPNKKELINIKKIVIVSVSQTFSISLNCSFVLFIISKWVVTFSYHTDISQHWYEMKVGIWWIVQNISWKTNYFELLIVLWFKTYEKRKNTFKNILRMKWFF